MAWHARPGLIKPKENCPAVRFLIFGAGAMGSLMGGLLSTRHDVTLVARAAHAQAISRDGLRIRGLTKLVARPQAVTEVGIEPTPPEVALIAVKAYDTQAALEALRPFWSDSIFLTLQNGLGNEEMIAERAKRVLGGVTSQGVTTVGPGEVYHAGKGETFIGSFQGTRKEEVEAVVEAFRIAGIQCSLSEDVLREKWKKTLVNACINPLTGLVRVKNGRLLESYALGEVVEMIINEGIRVASAHGIPVQKAELMERVWQTAHATAENKSSMLQDLERGRRTEIDFINGALERLGKDVGVPCPANSLLTRLIRGLEESVEVG